jgi:hypothetical protein
MADDKPTSLAEFVLETYKRDKKNRKPLEERWNRNSEAFRGIGNKAWKSGEAEGHRTDSVLNLTKQKITSWVALAVKIMLGGGDVPFELRPSPWDEIVGDELSPEEQDEQKKEILEMERLIRQQHLDCSVDRHFLLCLLSLGLHGLSYMKNIVLTVTRTGWRKSVPSIEDIGDMSRVQSKVYEQYEEGHLSPGHIYVSNWNIFRDMEEPFDTCSHVIHRQVVSDYWCRSRSKSGARNGWISVALDKAIKNKPSDIGSETESMAPALRDIQERQNNNIAIEFWGLAPERLVKEFEKNALAGVQQGTLASSQPATEELPGDDVECMITVVNHEICRFARTTRKERPFQECEAQKNPDANGGWGVGDDSAASQKIANGSLRALIDNANFGANVTGFAQRMYIDERFDGLRPGKIYTLAPSCPDARSAVSFADPPNFIDALLRIEELAEKSSDMDTMIPKITQGFDVKEPQMRAYVASQQIEKSGYFMEWCIRNIDEGLVEPMVEWDYNWNMEDPSITRGKGNYIVKALGIQSFRDKIERIAKLQQWLNIALTDPGLSEWADLKYALTEIGKALDIDNAEAMKTDEEHAADQAAQAQVQSKAMQLESDKKQAEIQKMQAEAAATTEKIGTDRALAISKIVKEHKPEPVEAVPGETENP